MKYKSGELVVVADKHYSDTKRHLSRGRLAEIISVCNSRKSYGLHFCDGNTHTRANYPYRYDENEIDLNKTEIVQQAEIERKMNNTI
jgi:hypothetical protein